MWGIVEPANDSALDMTLGFPADTLTWAGLQGVPEDGMLTVAVTGTAYKPKIDWQGWVCFRSLCSSCIGLKCILQLEATPMRCCFSSTTDLDTVGGKGANTGRKLHKVVRLCACIGEIPLHASMLVLLLCRAYHKLTSSALKWQTQAPTASETVSLKQAIANQALKGLGTLHHKVTSGSQAATSGHSSGPAVIPSPVAPVPWVVQE